MRIGVKTTNSWEMQRMRSLPFLTRWYSMTTALAVFTFQRAFMKLFHQLSFIVVVIVHVFRIIINAMSLSLSFDDPSYVPNCTHFHAALRANCPSWSLLLTWKLCHGRLSRSPPMEIGRLCLLWVEFVPQIAFSRVSGGLRAWLVYSLFCCLLLCTSMIIVRKTGLDGDGGERRSYVLLYPALFAVNRLLYMDILYLLHFA